MSGFKLQDGMSPFSKWRNTFHCGMVAPVRVDVTETIWIQWRERDGHHQRSDAEEDGKQDDLVKEFVNLLSSTFITKDKKKRARTQGIKKKS